MSSLTEKRRIHYEHSLSHNSTNISLGDIETNTDDLEVKMDSVIANTSHNEFTGSAIGFVVAGHATSTVIPVVDLGSASAPHKINIVGTTTHNNIDVVLQVSNDNVTYYDLPNITISTIGTNISGIGDLCFRYFKVNITDNTGSPVTVSLEYAVKNIN